ncbi:monovalent cation/H+ antiporter subunit D family protein [Thiocapsa rosea]|uniref:Multisubunit sodium/proton antiporter MrpD subunit n=1 Tax=Thiocapsa rosea TaxID=69360 RepID=A0A495V226_9GAMM|nr:monovalent cation/H+ antiporter subunit D family protein [Thiocapsa rosea]RKT43349.1 multisubunit sodium/proton antiporter MrpD subunit [Thiocapsa rosea]
MLSTFALLKNLPALQVVLPLLAAPLCLLLGRARLAWALATLVTWLGLAISLLLLWQVRDGAVLHYAFGDWPAPWGIEYVVDRLAGYVLLIVSLIAAVVMPYARQSIAQEIDPALQPLAYTLLLLCLAGLLGMAITGDAFNLFVLLEISSLSSYALISLGRDRRALTAAYQYLIMGTIGATFFIIGVGLLYVMTGTLNLADLAERVPELGETRTVKTAFAFITVGLALKLAMFPLHLWLPNAYTFAPSVVTAFLAATATKVALYAMIRFIYTVFGARFAFDEMHLEWLLLPLAAAGVLIASVVAVFQHDLKRMLAYSSVAQIGYMLLGIAMANVTGLTAGLLHLFNHALMKGALFLALGALFYRIGRSDIDAIAGIAREMPLTMAAFVVGGLSLIGVPLTVGFLSKWYLILAAIEHGWWPVVMLVLLSSLIAVLYIWRVVEAAYFNERPAGAAAVREAPAGLLIPIWLLVFANLYFGIDSSLTVGVAGDAAHGLFGAPQ